MLISFSEKKLQPSELRQIILPPGPFPQKTSFAAAELFKAGRRRIRGRRQRGSGGGGSFSAAPALPLLPPMPTLHSACCVARLGSPCWAQLAPLSSRQGQATETPARDAHSRPRGKMRGGGSGAHFAFLASGSLPIESLPLQERATTPCSSWVSCCPGRGTPQEDQCLGGQFAQDLGEEDCLGFGYELHGSSCSTLQWPHLSTHWTATPSHPAVGLCYFGRYYFLLD